MNQAVSLQRISQLLARFSEQVNILNDNGEFSINTHAENILIPILSDLYNCNLENINYSDKVNYPAIDLRDSTNKISFQITSTKGINKVKHTLNKFLEYDLYKSYDEVYVFIITDKQSSYSQSSIDTLLNNKFTFDTKKHIIDKQDIYKKLNEKNDLEQINRILQILESQFSDNTDLNKWKQYNGTLNDYDSFINKKFENIGVKGFSPKVDNTFVNLSLKNLYVPLNIEPLEKTLQSEIVKTDLDLDLDIDRIQSLDFVEQLFTKNYIVILGDPGSGKSTLLKYTSLMIGINRIQNIKYSLLVPIYIKAVEYSNYYKKYQKNLSEFILNHFDKKYEGVYLEALNNNRLILFFDGLDEISDKSLRNTVIEQVEDMTYNYPNSRYVVTSRVVGYKELSLNQKFSHYQLTDLSKTQISTFINKWFLNIYNDTEESKENAKTLIASIFRKEPVLKLAKNPLLLTIITLISNQGVELPKKRIQLYEIATFTFLENWVYLREKNNYELELAKEEIIELLTPIALYMHKTCPEGLIKEKVLIEKLSIEYANLFQYDSSHTALKSRKILNFLREDAGFFYEKGRDNSDMLFGFIHLTFQEYFSAIELANKWDDGSLEFKKYLFNSNWNEVLQLTAGVINQSSYSARRKTSKFINDILNVEDAFPLLDRPIRLSCEIIADDIDLDQSVIQTLVDYVYDKFLYFSSENISWYENCLSLLLEHKIAQNLILNKINSTLNKENTKYIVNLLMSNSNIQLVQEYLETIIKEDKNSLFLESMFSDIIIFPRPAIVKSSIYQDRLLENVSDIYDDEISLSFFIAYFLDDDFSFSDDLELKKRISILFEKIILTKSRNNILKNIYKFGLYNSEEEKWSDLLTFISSKFEGIDTDNLQKLTFYERKIYNENREEYFPLYYSDSNNKNTVELYISKKDINEIYIEYFDDSYRIEYNQLESELIQYSNLIVSPEECLKMIKLLFDYYNDNLDDKITLKDINLLYKNSMVIPSLYYQFNNVDSLYERLFSRAFELIKNDSDYFTLINNVNIENFLRIYNHEYNFTKYKYVGSEEFINKLIKLSIPDIQKTYLLYLYGNYTYDQIKPYIENLNKIFSDVSVREQSYILNLIAKVLLKEDEI